jgi:hypothetical protein
MGLQVLAVGLLAQDWPVRKKLLAAVWLSQRRVFAQKLQLISLARVCLAVA